MRRIISKRPERQQNSILLAIGTFGEIPLLSSRRGECLQGNRGIGVLGSYRESLGENLVADAGFESVFQNQIDAHTQQVAHVVFQFDEPK